MGRPEKLDADNKTRALDAIKRGEGYAKVSADFGVSEMTLRRYIKTADKPVSPEPVEAAPTFPEAA